MSEDGYAARRTASVVFSKLCKLEKILTPEVLAAISGATSPSGTNLFVTNADISLLSGIVVVDNFSSLPPPATATGGIFYAENSQGTPYIGVLWGGNYYPKGLYYSNGISWSFMEVPIQSTQIEVDAGINDNKFVTPKTFEEAAKWGTKAPLVHTHPISGITNLSLELAAKEPVLNWMTLVRGYAVAPTLLLTIPTGDVWQYLYESTPINTTYYRLVPSGVEEDAFYTTFTAGVLSGLVATKKIQI